MIRKKHFGNRIYVYITALLLVLVLCLTACGSSEEKTNSGNTAETSTEESSDRNDGQSSDREKDNTGADSSSDGKVNGSTDELSKIAFTVGEAPVSTTEIMLYSRSKAEEYESVYGKEIWDLVLDGTQTTVGMRFKEELMKQIIYVKIVCAEAPGLGIALDENEQLDVLVYTEDYLALFTREELAEYGITYDLVKQIYSENMLANKVYDIITLNIDTSVTEDEVRNMNLEYIFISKFFRDANGKQTEYSDSEKEAIKKKANEYRETLMTMEDFISLSALEQDEYQVSSIIGDKDAITQKTNTQIGKLAFGLAEGEFSELYEDEYGYYLLYCLDDSDEAATEAAKIRILTARQEEMFEEKYTEWEKNTKIRINYDVWNELRLWE